MKTKDPLLRSALWLQQCHQLFSSQHDRGQDSALDTVAYQAKILVQHLEACRKARSRGWHSAAAQMETRVGDTLRQLQYAITCAQNKGSHLPVLPQPTLRDLYQELNQLQQEFLKVTIEPQHHLLTALTDSIELEGICLGEFRLELHLDRLDKHADVSAFDVVALDPNPPYSSQDVIHPHGRDNQLCAGDATGPIALALEEGRFCDAFLAVNAVLHEYNPHSPYVSLDKWQGVACADCGSLMDEEHSFYCEDCFTFCDVCESSCCRGCLEQDRESGRSCCRSCRQYCRRCRRMVDSGSFDDETQFCPGCLELHLEEQQSNQFLQTQETKDEKQRQLSDPRPQSLIASESI